MEESKFKIQLSHKKGTNLEDPLVDDDDSDIEYPPLKNSQKRSNHAPLANQALFHHLRPESTQIKRYLPQSHQALLKFGPVYEYQQYSTQRKDSNRAKKIARERNGIAMKW